MSEIHVQSDENIIDPISGLSVGMKVYQTREALRDQFAGQALHGFLANYPSDGLDAIAKAAYEMADAMLAAREKGQQ